MTVRCSLERAPVGVGAFEPVLVAQHFTGPEAKADEIDLQLVLVRREIARATSRRSPSAETSCGTPLTRNPLINTGGGGGGGFSARARAVPGRSSCRTRARRRGRGRRRRNKPGAQTVRRREMLDAAGRRIEPVESVPAADVNVPVGDLR